MKTDNQKKSRPPTLPANVRAAVIGSGAFGTAMATVLARKGYHVGLWCRTDETAARINESRENATYLPGFKLHDGIQCSADVTEVVRDAHIVLLAIPAQFLRPFLQAHRAVFPVGVPLVACAKGIECHSLQTPYEIMEDELPGKYRKNVGVLAGPSFAKEIMQGQPTNVCVAAADRAVAVRIQTIIAQKTFRCYTSTDSMGCEVAGAVKNVLAIAAGAADGMGFGSNTRAALVCRGLVEMGRLAATMGSNGEALAGLGGVGDLMLTCTSPQSRNFNVGRRIAVGETLEDIAKTTKSVAEGVASAESVRELCKAKGIEMPICQKVYEVLYEKKNVMDALEELLDREMGSEM